MVPILASELRPIRVNAVVPGVVDTPWWSRVPDEARKELFEKSTPHKTFCAQNPLDTQNPSPYTYREKAMPYQ
jgi:NAD(P)-dependent dehydrogenase (short-subunit alcohol dehydrogenase family)